MSYVVVDMGEMGDPAFVSGASSRGASELRVSLRAA